jgi:thiol:disulfide interchange protein DsbD
MIFHRIVCSAIAVFIGAYGGITLAEPVRDQHVTAALISEVDAFQPGQPFRVGLLMDHDPHWHTYWRNPGDSGLATTIAWTLPPGFTAGPIEWPVPQRIAVGPLVSYGYEGKILLITSITPPANADPRSVAIIKAKVDWLMCEEACIPGQAKLELSLRASGGMAVPNSDASPIFEKMQSTFPSKESDWEGTAVASADGKHIVVTLKPTELSSGKPLPNLEDVTFFAADELAVEPSAPQPVTRTGTSYALTLTRPAGAQPIAQLKGILSADPGFGAMSGTRGWMIDLPVSGQSAAVTPASKAGEDPDASGRAEKLGFGAMSEWLLDQFGIAGAMLLGVLGGMVLNLMPCVLPVLSLKVFSVVKHAHDGSGLRHGWAYLAGVLVSFLILSIVLVALRAAGTAVGWGFQLQNPVFVFLLCLLFFLFGLSMLGVFEIGVSLVGVDTKMGVGGGLKGSFFTGILATAAATPCMAPGLGPAVGFALTQPAMSTILVLQSVGLGLALPFLLLAAFPKWAAYLPKPGAWMETFKQFLGFMLIASAAALAYVFGVLTSVAGLGVLLGLLVVAAMAAWIYGKWSAPVRSLVVRWCASGTSAAMLAAVVAGGVFASQSMTAIDENAAAARAGDMAAWHPFDPQRLDKLRAAGTPVFIDFTATWCITCQLNKAVLYSQVVSDAFAEAGVVKMKADWTRHDPAITKALESFGRSGVPLYVLYGREPSRPPVVFDEILTTAQVVDAVKAMPMAPTSTASAL